MASLDRGFKTWAERTALNLRRELGLKSFEPLEPLILAEYLGIEVITPSQIPGLPLNVMDQLLTHDPWGWSAVSLLLADGDSNGLVIYNPRKSKGRRASDIMHELAHFILDHQPGMIVLSADGNIAMRSYDQKQEEEANWLAWSLLLPRDALLFASRAKYTSAQIAERYGVAQNLVEFRLKITGVAAQVAVVSRRTPR